MTSEEIKLKSAIEVLKHKKNKSQDNKFIDAIDTIISNIEDRGQCKFKQEIKERVNQKCNEINHLISGCDSPFDYLQIRNIQDCLNEISGILEYKTIK